MTQFKSSINSNLIIVDEPVFKSEYGMQKSYYLYEDFDKGVVPAGWTVATLNAGSAVTFVSNYQALSIGQARLVITTVLASSRAGIRFANAYNYLLQLDDAPYTKWGFNIRPEVAVSNVVMQIGLTNTIAAALGGFGNTIALRYDPTNLTGENPALIANWFLFTKRTGFGTNAVDTGIPLTNVNYEEWVFVLDNTNIAAPVLSLYYNGLLVAQIVSMVNVPLNVAAGNSLNPHAFIGNGAAVGGAAQALRFDKFMLYKLFT
jgi:hypothetical protein